MCEALESIFVQKRKKRDGAKKRRHKFFNIMGQMWRICMKENSSFSHIVTLKIFKVILKIF